MTPGSRMSQLQASSLSRLYRYSGKVGLFLGHFLVTMCLASQRYKGWLNMGDFARFELGNNSYDNRD